MIYLRAENLCRRYGERTLFKNLNLSIAKGERIALIAKNGTGKSSLLEILTGKEESDNDGKVIIDKNITWTYLQQEPVFNPNHTVLEAIFNTEHPKFKTIATFELLTERMENDPENVQIHEEMQKVMEDMLKTRMSNYYERSTHIYILYRALQWHHVHEDHVWRKTTAQHRPI